VRLVFITGTPANVREGSGTWTGISTLASALRALGHSVDVLSADYAPGDYAAQRAAFNERLAGLDRSRWDVTVGFDMDGHILAGSGGPPHVASIKGVIADELLYENGDTRREMEEMAVLERDHVRSADRVVTTSLYSADRLCDLYGLRKAPAVVPELIDLPLWLSRLSAAPAVPRGAFTVLCVCRLYPRKRVDVLLEAAALLRAEIPDLAVRIVGDGPEGASLRARHAALGLDGFVRWLGYVAPEELAAEYRRADIFCLPSVQEGFGIVFLEAMAAGLPVVAARAAAVPEVVAGGLLAEPGDAASLAEALLRMRREPGLREAAAAAGRVRAGEFDAPRVARRFLEAIAP
jgi:glycosyltransferase involved in cell wall biosynthesis